MIPVELHHLWPLFVRGAGIASTVVALSLVPLVLVRRKEPSSTIAWILTLVFLPAVGALLFLMFGRDRVRWPAKRKRELDALVRAQVAQVAPGAEVRAPRPQAPAASELGSGAPPTALERALFR